MQINNVTQFVNFLSSNSFQDLDTMFIQTIQCVSKYSSTCSCYKAEDKMKMYNLCCKLYLDSVVHVIPKFKNIILQKIPEGKITFLNDNGSVIAIVSR